MSGMSRTTGARNERVSVQGVGAGQREVRARRSGQDLGSAEEVPRADEARIASGRFLGMVSDRDIPQGILNDVAEIPKNGDEERMIILMQQRLNPRKRG